MAGPARGAETAEALAERAARTPRGAHAKRAAPTAIHDLFMARLEEIERRVSSELARPAEASGAVQELLLDVAREVWAHTRAAAVSASRPGAASAFLAAWVAAGPTDDIGVDESLRDRVHDVLRPLGRLWLGLDAGADIGHDDLGGPALLLFNRGADPLPVEPLVLWSFLRERAGGSGRRVYVLWSAETMAQPFLGEWLNRLGIFAATAANCRALLERGATVVAFPEGEQALAKTYERRYRLERFDDDALIETAMTCGARIVPGAVLGSEESFPLIGRVAGWPLTPFFPVLGLLGLLPLPLTWRVQLGAPIQYGDDARDGARAGAVIDAARSRMQELLVNLLAARRTIFYG
jgi:1-acyl-sn-glycerol-3-phosphate acyltransferase